MPSIESCGQVDACLGAAEASRQAPVPSFLASFHSLTLLALFARAEGSSSAGRAGPPRAAGAGRAAGGAGARTMQAARSRRR